MRIATLMVAMFCTMFAGCADLSGKIVGSTTDTENRTARMLKSVGQPEAAGKTASPVSYESGLWLATAPVKLDKREALPPIFNSSATFDRSVSSLSEFAERIALRSGMHTRVTPDAVTAAARAQQPASGAAVAPPIGAALPPPTINGGPVPAFGMPFPAPRMTGAIGPEIRISYPSGTLKGLLDAVAARFGVFWKYADGSILFFYTDVRTFQVNAIPGDSALSATVASGSTAGDSGQGGGSGGQGGTSGGTNATNSQNTEVKSQLSVFASIEKSIGTMLSPDGKVVASPATGTITVTDTPYSLARIAQFVENENKALSRQVMINVTVLAVTLSDGENYGINWTLVYSNLQNRYGIANAFASDPSSTSFSAAVLRTANSKFAGSSLVIDALSTQGRVRRETTASVATLNNQPVPVQVAKQTSYLKSSQSTIAANIGTTTSLNPGTVTSGFNMTILPHVLANGTVMLQFSTDISSLRRIRTVVSNGSSIESPEVDTRNFLQRVAMRSGETLIVSGFEQVEEDLNRQGVGKADNFLLGGGVKAQSGKEVIVILVTPIAMSGA
jgi:type IVB pilus formation R64 PilN family outer membrane protein